MRNIPAQDWFVDGPQGPEVIASMSETLTNAGLLTPPVPEHLRSELMLDKLGFAWGSAPWLDPWWAYSVFGEASPGPFPESLDPDHGDFWLFGQRGYGINSYGIGLFARLGATVIAQQFLWGGAYVDRARSNAMVNAGTAAWAASLARNSFGEGPPRYLVLFSSYRGYAEILTCSDDVVGSEIGRLSSHLPGWRSVIRALAPDRRSPEVALRRLVYCDNPILASAARHLQDLIRTRD